MGIYIDIHTHRLSCRAGVLEVLNLMAHEGAQALPAAASIGWHPWYFAEGDEQQVMERLLTVGAMPEIVAIGECGLDALRGSNPKEQERIFERHIAVSEELQKPLIVHCVRTHDRLQAIHRQRKPKQAWLIHGFRGSSEIARRWLEQGVYLSFGSYLLQGDKLRKTLWQQLSIEQLFLETDASPLKIEELYAQAADWRGLSLAALQEQLLHNFQTFYGRAM